VEGGVGGGVAQQQGLPATTHGLSYKAQDMLVAAPRGAGSHPSLTLARRLFILRLMSGRRQTRMSGLSGRPCGAWGVGKPQP
jgi:hypothetical protein